MPLGFRISSSVDRPDPKLVAELAEIPTTDLSDVMYGSATMTHRIAPVWGPVKRVAGPAVTISVPTASFNVLKAGLNQSQSGDVVVVNAFGNPNFATVGANVIRGLLHRGIRAYIVDGAVRDVADIRADGMPVYATSVTTADGPNGPHVGEVNYPIACGGIVVNPGSIVVADEDGIVVVPGEFAREVIDKAKALDEKHAAIQPVLLRGEVTNIAAIEAGLRDAGCEFA
jgi:4-hydroxy-4-methyl-2-oxoglutarate aldolase